ncbi:MAG: hypothetical protein V3T83_19015 [Acidobacteriota bacterium]
MREICESLCLALGGGALGILLAWWGMRWIVSMAQQLPRTAQIGFDWPVLAFAALATLATALLVGLIPAAQTARKSHRGLLSLNPSRSSGGWGARWMTIVGIAENVRSTSLTSGDSVTVYTSYPQRTDTWQRFGTLVQGDQGGHGGKQPKQEGKEAFPHHCPFDQLVHSNYLGDRQGRVHFPNRLADRLSQCFQVALGPRFSTSRKMWARRAPSAMRMPISRRLWAKAEESTPSIPWPTRLIFVKSWPSSILTLCLCKAVNSLSLDVRPVRWFVVRVCA